MSRQGYPPKSPDSQSIWAPLSRALNFTVHPWRLEICTLYVIAQLASSGHSPEQLIRLISQGQEAG